MKHLTAMMIHSFYSQQRPRFLRTWAPITLSVALTGCGGPKYTKDFQEWLGIKLATTQPMKLERVTVEEITGGKIEAVFTFRGQFSVTRDLYEVVRPAEDLNAHSAGQRLIELGTSRSGEGGALFEALLRGRLTPILRIVTPKGHKGKLFGKARAEMNNDGSWRFEILEVDGNTLDGKAPPEGEKWLADGSKEAREHLANLKKQIDAANAFADAAEKKAEEARKKEEARLAEEQRKVEEEAKKRETAFLDEIAAGREIVGVWQGEEAAGEIGIRFGEQMKMAEGYSIQGQLFDPSEPSRAKAFSGTAVGNGTTEKPYTLDLRVASIDARSNDAERRRAYNKTAGFLVPHSQFAILLKYNPDGSFSGEMRGHQYSFYADVAIGIDSRVPLQFPKGYAPKSSSSRTESPPSSTEAAPLPARGREFSLSPKDTGILAPMSQSEKYSGPAKTEKAATEPPPATAPKSQTLKTLVGVWRGEGGTGLGTGTKAVFELMVNADKSFKLECAAFEPAHGLNPYPTTDRIRAEGSWTIDEDGDLVLTATISDFVRIIQTGEAARQGFLPDTESKVVTKHLHPLPMEGPITFGKRADGTLYMTLATFKAKGPLTSLPIFRQISGVELKKAQSESQSIAAPPAGGRKFRLSPEETERQLVESAALNQNVNDALKRRDPAGFHKAVQELRSRYPDSPNTLLAEMILAAMQDDKAKIRQLHDTLVNEYPLKDAYKEMVNDLYQNISAPD